MADETGVLVRVWLPDRPGALGLVASRIGAVRGDIVGIDVLERGDGVAIDEFAVRLADADAVAVLVREIEEVDGASVEEVRVVGRFPDARLDALDAAAGLCESTDADELADVLMEHVRQEFFADWCALLRGGAPVASSGDACPPPAQLVAVTAGALESRAIAEGDAGPGDLAVARLPRLDAALAVGRSGQAFRRRERLQLLALARAADRAWELIDTNAR